MDEVNEIAFFLFRVSPIWVGLVPIIDHSKHVWEKRRPEGAIKYSNAIISNTSNPISKNKTSICFRKEEIKKEVQDLAWSRSY
jgi:hypothetical protein